MNEHALAMLASIGVPACLLFAGSVVLFSKTKTVPVFLQLIGAGALVMVVMTHVAETFDLVSWMQWGLEHSVGHYLDLSSAVIGVTLFPAATCCTHL
jgi:uncharacterized membrane protein